MKYSYVIVIFLSVFHIKTSLAQSNQDLAKEVFIPASSNQTGKLFPQVNSEGRIRVSISAPEAQKVQLDLSRKIYDLTRDENGIWTGESDPQDEGFHMYQFIVDGVKVPDPGSSFFYDDGRWGSGIEIPSKDEDFYALKHVPHGQIRENLYYSKVNNSWRRCFVYTPPNYDRDLSHKYPVLYLQHGGGGNETGWPNQGKVNFIMDNLIADDKIAPFIIVMDNGNWSMPKDAPMGKDGLPLGWTNNFRRTLIEDIIPMIDSNYRTKSDRSYRALAGWSMGGMQTRLIALASPETFSYIGMFSGGSITMDDVNNAPGFTKDKIKLYFNGYGSRELSGGLGAPISNNDVKQGRDFFGGYPKESVDSLKKEGFNAVFYLSNLTAHEWQTWRRSFYEFAPLLFRD